MTDEIEDTDRADEQLESVASGVEPTALHANVEPPPDETTADAASGTTERRDSLVSRVRALLKHGRPG